MKSLAAFMVFLTLPALSFEQAELEPDHLFIVVSRGAPEAEVLRSAGLQQAPEPATHDGQGTASTFFSFDNSYLELIWVEKPKDLETAVPELAARIHGEADHPSPFGLGLRRTGDDDSRIPFSTRPHTAEWMIQGTAIGIAAGQTVTEPMIFVVPGYMGWPSFLDARPEIREQLDHPAGLNRLTEIRFHGPRPQSPSQALRSVMETGAIGWIDSDEHLLELVFDEGLGGKTIDCRPDLPLIIRH
jgi:hypothetical protein